MNNVKYIAKLFGGSKLYGLDNEKSDTDIKGIFIPNLKDLILDCAPKHISFKEENVENEFFSIHSFLKNAVSGQDVTFVMLHAPKNKIIEDSELYKYLRDNRSKFYTKRIIGSLGYSKSQSIKYSLRAERMNAVKLAIDKLTEIKNKGILKVAQSWDELPTDGKYLIKTVCADSREDDKRVWEVAGKGVTVNTNPIYAISFLTQLYEKYGDRVKVAASLTLLDFKSLSHAFRCAYQLLNLYRYGDFTFPLPESDFIRSVKEGKVNYLRDEIDYKLNSLITEVEVLSEKSNYPEKVDINFVNNIILNCYGAKQSFEL